MPDPNHDPQCPGHAGRTRLTCAQAIRLAAVLKKIAEAASRDR